MDAPSLKNKIFETLKIDSRLWDEKTQELNQTLLLDLVENIDEKIIKILLEDDDLRNKFFVKIKDAYVFKTNDFRFFIEENRVYNSYTKYKNRIGLSDGKKFLKDSTDVVLNFPYKDCILEGGQSKEEGLDCYYEYDEKITKTDEKKGCKAQSYNLKKSKRNEIFFNQILAQDEIDRLFDEKAFVNWKRYTKDGEQKVKEIKRDKEGTIKENLIIKGNNLLALHSLKSQFKGKVKLIYIDPPYNTGNDSFAYNDRFNHSTWLTFMKNRLEAAKDLLSEDGVIFVQCDDNEQAYLKVLMDEIFGKDNFVNTITVKMSETSGVKMSHSSKRLPKIKEGIHFFAKNKNSILLNEIVVQKELNGKDYNYLKYYKKIISNYNESCLNCKNWIIKSISDYLKEQNVKFKTRQEEVEFYLNNSHRIIYRTNNKSFTKIKGIKRLKTPTGLDKINWDGKEMLFLKNHLNEGLCDLWTDISTINLNKEGSVKMDNGKKPEILIQRIIEISTQKGDIVLDYHLGSGTTCAATHKMGRQYIGIEQMDYIEDISVQRLKKVIDGEQGGISKKIGWQGGGDFIYFELAKSNEKAKEEINACKDFKSLEKLFDTLYNKYFLNYNLKIKEFKEKVIKEENFKALPLEEQKKMFLAMLDLNQMYVQKTEMEDIKFAIDKKDQELTNEFYNSGE